jgi:tripartite ATP-independent transporter DctP family solute receptor
MKYFISLVVVFFALLSVNAALAAPIVVKVGSIQSDTFYMNKYMDKFEEIVNQKTNNAYEFKRFYNSVLGSEVAMIEQMGMGTLDMQFGYSAVMSNYVREFEAIGLPGVLANFDEVRKILNGRIGDELTQEFMKKTGVRILWFVDQAYRNIFLNNINVQSIEDLKGIKIRAPDSPLYIKVLRTLGINPVPLAFGLIYTSVKTGVVDGHEQEDEGVIPMKFYEIENREVVSHHIYQAAIWEVSEKFFQKLPKEHQQIFLDAAKEAGIWFQPYTGDKAEAASRKELEEKHGFKVTYLDQKKVAELLTPMVDEYAKERGLFDFVQEIRKELGK